MTNKMSEDDENKLRQTLQHRSHLLSEANSLALFSIRVDDDSATVGVAGDGGWFRLSTKGKRAALDDAVDLLASKINETTATLAEYGLTVESGGDVLDAAWAAAVETLAENASGA